MASWRATGHFQRTTASLQRDTQQSACRASSDRQAGLDGERAFVAGLPLRQQRAIGQVEARRMFNEAYIKRRTSKEGGKDESSNRNLQHWSSSASAGKAQKLGSKPIAAPSQTSLVGAVAWKNPINRRRNYRPATLFSASGEWAKVMAVSKRPLVLTVRSLVGLSHR